MNEDVLDGKWNHISNKFQSWWGTSPDKDFNCMGGKFDAQTGHFQ
jgi:hypothetical protein